jgi:chromosome segregation ATPase
MDVIGITSLPRMVGFSSLSSWSQVSSTQAVLLCGAVGVLILMAWSIGRREKRAARMPQPSALEAQANDRRLQSSAREINELLLELDQAAQRLHARLDSRINKLESAIKEADQRVASLRQEQAVLESTPRIDFRLAPVDPHADEINDAAERDDDRFSTIHRLADSGLSALQIAQEVDKPTGEIELILALRKAKLRTGQRQPDIARAG